MLYFISFSAYNIISYKAVAVPPSIVSTTEMEDVDFVSSFIYLLNKFYSCIKAIGFALSRLHLARQCTLHIVRAYK